MNVPFEIGKTFFDRIRAVRKRKLIPEKEIKKRIQNYKLAKSSKKPQEMLVQGATSSRWIQIKDTLTPSGNILTLMTNVTKIVEQEEERKRLVDAIDNFPSPVLFWDENDKLIIGNNKAIQLNKNLGIKKLKLKKGLPYQEMLKAQIEENFYISNDNQTGIAPKKRGKELERYFEKRMRYRKTSP